MTPKFVLIFLIVGMACISGTQANNLTSSRKAKVLSLFSVVSFNNEACRSTLTYTTNTIGGIAAQRNRNGTCFTRDECASRGGQVQGTCAAGFGVCCVFLIFDASRDISQNCSYIQNPGYPLVYTDTTDLQYTIRKSSNDVCQLRLDFESFSLIGTNAQSEIGGGACIDTFVVDASNGFPVPTICGQNQGQHIYVDIGGENSASANLDFTFTGDSTVRQWDIKVTQVPCSNFAAPNGCLQYHVGLSGRLTTFNFIPTDDNHLANQNYGVCIKQEPGFCCIQYSQCTDPNSFGLSSGKSTVNVNHANVLVGSFCTEDFIIVESSGGVCNPGSAGTTNNKYCGSFLGSTALAVTSSPICDCTSPFRVDIITDGNSDQGTAITINTKASRGICLTYTQIPC